MLCLVIRMNKLHTELPETLKHVFEALLGNNMNRPCFELYEALEFSWWGTCSVELCDS